MIFPDQTIPESERDDIWYNGHHTFADRIWAKKQARLAKINTAYTRFHGKQSEAADKEWTDRYKQGGTNLSKAKFKHYKIVSTKLERLHGEFVKKILKPSVETRGKDSLSAKMKNIGLQLAMQSKEMQGVIQQFQEGMDMDLTGGVPMVDLQDPQQVKRLNPKYEYERFMTAVLQEQIKRLRVKDLGADTLLDAVIVSECHATAFLQPNKKVDIERIHPRNKIFEEIPNDTYLEDTQFHGENLPMSQQNILSTYGHKMDEEQREQVRTLNNHPEAWISGNSTYWWEEENELIGWVQHLTWMSQKEVYEKVQKSENNEFVDHYENLLSKEYYNKNKAQIEREAKAGKYEIRKGYLTTLYESTRIGKDIYLDQREVPFIITLADDDKVYYNQTSLLLNTVDGRRLSMFEKLYDLDELYDIIMWQIRKELGKHKGNVVTIDRKYFDSDVTENDILFNIAEEGVVVINTASEEVQANPERSSAIESGAVGSMETLNQLLQLKMDIERMVDRISGINEYMEGTAPVSATATQNVQAQEAGRTITSPIFYFHNQFMENLLFRILELTIYSITYLEDDSFDEILGENGLYVLTKLRDLDLEDLGVTLPDPNKEVEQRRILEFWSSQGINAKELKIHQAMQAALADTVAEAEKILTDGFDTVEKMRQAEQKAMLDSQERNVQATNETQRAMMEDAQEHDMDKIIMQGVVDGEKGAQEAKQMAALEKQKQQASQGQRPPSR